MKVSIVRLKLQHTWEKVMKCPRNTLPNDRPLWTLVVSCTIELYIRAHPRNTRSSSVGDGIPKRCGFPKSHPFAIDKFHHASCFFNFAWQSSHNSNEGIEPSWGIKKACMLASCEQIQILYILNLRMWFTWHKNTTTSPLHVFNVFNVNICYIYLYK